MAAAKAEVREAYVGPAPEGCGLEEAFALSLLDLLSQDRLPANPYFVFANRLITYVDQREFWLKSDADILALLEEGGYLQLVDPKSKLAKLKGSPYAWGLPHMLIGADLDGLHEIREALRGSLPESFFPSANQKGAIFPPTSTPHQTRGTGQWKGGRTPPFLALPSAQ